jgi:polyisoprenoid-binding protein YceI
VSIPFEFTGTAKDPFGNTRVGFEGSLTVNRKDWGIEWNAPLETGGVMLGDKVQIELDIQMVKDSDA